MYDVIYWGCALFVVVFLNIHISYVWFNLVYRGFDWKCENCRDLSLSFMQCIRTRMSQWLQIGSSGLDKVLSNKYSFKYKLYLKNLECRYMVNPYTLHLHSRIETLFACLKLLRINPNVANVVDLGFDTQSDILSSVK